MFDTFRTCEKHHTGRFKMHSYSRCRHSKRYGVVTKSTVLGGENVKIGLLWLQSRRVLILKFEHVIWVANAILMKGHKKTDCVFFLLVNKLYKDVWQGSR